MASVRFRPAAVVAVSRARAWYDTAQPGLGDAFIADLHACISVIEQHPEAWAEALPSVRRALLRHFPYVVWYTVVPGCITIRDLRHQSRRPRGGLS